MDIFNRKRIEDLEAKNEKLLRQVSAMATALGGYFEETKVASENLWYPLYGGERFYLKDKVTFLLPKKKGSK